MTTATDGGTISGECQPVPRVSPVWTFLIILLGVFAIGHHVGQVWDEWRPSRLGDLGAQFKGCDLSGFCKIGVVSPGGSAAAAGLSLGDEIRLDRAMDGWRTLRAGEQVGFVLRRGEALSHHAMTATPYVANARDRTEAVAGIFIHAVRILTCLIGMFVVLRGGTRLSNILFGAVLVCLGFGSSVPALAESNPWFFPIYAGSAAVMIRGAQVLFLAFALAALHETTGQVPRFWKGVFVINAVLQLLSGSYEVWDSLTARELVSVSRHLQILTAVMDIGYLLAFVALAVTWGRSRGRDRARCAYLMFAGGLLILSQHVAVFVINLTGNDRSLSNPLVLFLVAGSVIGSSVFAYAVLRHRVIDVGFAVNRTLVYGVLSAILLTGFGLMEWTIEHFVPIEGREQNALLDALVAVMVFLTFHRIRDFVEHVIEGLFFRRWQDAEAALRRHVREAAFATRPETLIRGFTAALTAYSEGAASAVYLLTETGGYQLSGGSLDAIGEELDPDDPTLIAMRAEPRVFAADERSSTLKAALAAPMVNRNEITGIVLLGPKPSGHAFRPDEVNLIDWATRQIGLDLHALIMERLRAAAEEMRREISQLEARNKDLRLALGRRASA